MKRKESFNNSFVYRPRGWENNFNYYSGPQTKEKSGFLKTALMIGGVALFLYGAVKFTGGVDSFRTAEVKASNEVDGGWSEDSIAIKMTNSVKNLMTSEKKIIVVENNDPAGAVEQDAEKPIEEDKKEIVEEIAVEEAEVIENITVESEEKAPAPKGDCLSEIAKYDWPQDQAEAIMWHEGGNNPNAHNYNLATGDDSWGCFQVNILGNMKRERPSSQELVDPRVNVEWAYRHYVKEGRTFCKSSGWKTSCGKIRNDGGYVH